MCRAAYRCAIWRNTRQMTTATSARIPEGLHSVTPYLAGEGAAKLIDFMERGFRREGGGAAPASGDPEKIMHSKCSSETRGSSSVTSRTSRTRAGSSCTSMSRMPTPCTRRRSPPERARCMRRPIALRRSRGGDRRPDGQLLVHRHARERSASRGLPVDHTVPPCESCAGAHRLPEDAFGATEKENVSPREYLSPPMGDVTRSFSRRTERALQEVDELRRMTRVEERRDPRKPSGRTSFPCVAMYQ